MNNSILICPICKHPLTYQNRNWCCSNRHNFDQSKEGYVNLLPVQFKHSSQPGDDVDMLKARQQFLNAGYYQPLYQSLIQLASQFVIDPENVLDIGCGEGYYTDKLRQLTPHVWGLDIAKRGIRLAAKHYPQCQFLIASNNRLPFASESLDLITRIFAPQQDDEIVRCLKTGAHLITVVPGSHHLKQFRERIYPVFRPHQDEAKPISEMKYITSERLNYQIEPSQNDRENLMVMTPFNWKLNEEIRQKFKEDEQSIDVAFTLHLYQKN